MIVKRKSQLSGKTREQDIPCTPEQLKEYDEGSPRLVQEIFPDLTPDQREFIMTGITQDEWDKTFGKFD